MGSYKKRCKVCGAEYEICYACEKKNSWRVHTDTAEHFYIFGVLMDYKVTCDAGKAYAALKRRGVGLDGTEEFLPEVQALLDEIEIKAGESTREEEEDPVFFEV